MLYKLKNKYKKFLAEIYRLTTPLLIYLLFFSCFCSDRLYYLGGEKDEGIKGDVKINTEILIEDSSDITEDNIENSDDIIFDNNSLADINDTNYIDELAELESEEDAYFFDCVSDPLTDARVENICNTKIDLDVLTMEEMKPISQFYMGGWMNGICSFAYGDNKNLYVLYSDGPESNANLLFIFGANGELFYKSPPYDTMLWGPAIDQDGNAYFSAGTMNPFRSNNDGRFYKYDRKRGMKVLKDFRWPQRIPPVIDWTNSVIFFANKPYDGSSSNEYIRYMYKYKNDEIILEKQIDDGYFWVPPFAIIDSDNMIYAISTMKKSYRFMSYKVEYYDSDFNKIWEVGLDKFCSIDDTVCDVIKMISDGENLYVLLSRNNSNKIISINREGKINWVYEMLKDEDKIILDMVIDEDKNIRFFRKGGGGSKIEFGIINRCGKLIKKKKLSEILYDDYKIFSNREGIKLLAGNNLLFGGQLYNDQPELLRFYAILDSELNLKKIYYYSTDGGIIYDNWYSYLLNYNLILDCKELIFLYPWSPTRESTLINAFLYRVEFPDFAIGKSPWPMERGDQKNTGRVQLYR